MGGYSTHLQLGSSRVGFLEIGYANRNSHQLKLFDGRTEASVGLYYATRDGLSPVHAVNVLMGPEFIHTLAMEAGSQTSIGSQYGARAQVEVESRFSEDAHFKWGTQALFRRLNSYSFDGIPSGGAGLMSISPGLSYKVLNSLWVGARMNLALLRSPGRESLFGNPTLPGLFGNSWGLTLDAATF